MGMAWHRTADFIGAAGAHQRATLQAVRRREMHPHKETLVIPELSRIEDIALTFEEKPGYSVDDAHSICRIAASARGNLEVWMHHAGVNP